LFEKRKDKEPKQHSSMISPNQQHYPSAIQNLLDSFHFHFLLWCLQPN